MYPYPGYPSPGHPPPPGYYPAGPATPVWKPGVIPLRPLSLSDIFNGAVGYVRANPKPTLGLTTVIVLISTVIGFITALAARRINGDISTIASVVAGAAATLLATTLLSGMLTVIVARAVMGVRISVGEAWRRVRGRLPALIALTLLEITAVVTLIAVVVLVIAGVARAASGPVAALVGFPLILALIATLAYLYAGLALAPVAIVLENKGVLAAARRSLALCRNRFWRILGIMLLAGLVAKLISGAISVPFEIAGQMISFGSSTPPPTPLRTAIATVGQAVGGILTTPFVAGVVTLLYVDARIRSEAFDFTLLRAHPADADRVWLTP